VATSSYEIPDLRLPEQQRLGWCLEAQQEGEGWLKAQRPALQWESALQVLSEPDAPAQVDSGVSALHYNKIKRIARELVASLSNFRHEGEFKVTWDDSLHDVAHTLTNLDRNWYRTTYANEQHRAALQYAVATGTGYLFEGWDKHYWSPYRGDIRLSAYAPQDVTFVQLPKNHDIQRAYCVIIREELPINLAKAIYSETNREFAAQLVPDRDSPGWLQKGLQKLQQFVSPALRVAGRSPNQAAQASFPTVDIFHMYVYDRSVNETGSPISMGVKDTNWAYTVPSMGDPIQTSIVNPATGNFFTEPATPEHCKLFPLRRYVIFSRTALCYDGSSPYWHGEVPLARIRFTDWAWEALGQSQITDVMSIQSGIVALMRMIEDSAAARLDPGMLYDDSLVASTWADAVNPRKAGTRAKAPLSQGEVIKPILPPEYYNVPDWIQNWIQAQEDRMDYLSTVRDLVAIAKAKQVPGADTLEKLMEMAGPIVQDTVRQIEHPLQRLGDWRGALYFQFYTRTRMLTVTGPEGVDVDKKYEPEQLAKIRANETPEQFAMRKRGYLADFRYAVTESGINEIHRMTNKLLYIQLQKLGFPISWWTLARICQIPNFGPPPKGTNTELERWIAQQRIQIDLAMDQQEQVASRMGGMAPPGMEGSEQSVVDKAGAAASGAGGNGSGPEGGRPPSMKSAPRLESKDGGSRSTITTS